MEKGIILSGTDSIAVAKQDDLVYRLEPIPVIVPIVIYDVKPYSLKVIELKDYLQQDYQVVGMTVDFAVDDAGAYYEGGESGGNNRVQVDIRRVKNDKPVASMKYDIYENGIAVDALFLNREEDLAMQSTSELNSMTLYCTPVVLEKPIVLGIKNI